LKVSASAASAGSATTAARSATRRRRGSGWGLHRSIAGRQPRHRNRKSVGSSRILDHGSFVLASAGSAGGAGDKQIALSEPGCAAIVPTGQDPGPDRTFTPAELFLEAGKEQRFTLRMPHHAPFVIEPFTPTRDVVVGGKLTATEP